MVLMPMGDSTVHLFACCVVTFCFLGKGLKTFSFHLRKRGALRMKISIGTGSNGQHPCLSEGISRATDRFISTKSVASGSVSSRASSCHSVRALTVVSRVSIAHPGKGRLQYDNTFQDVNYLKRVIPGDTFPIHEVAKDAAGDAKCRSKHTVQFGGLSRHVFNPCFNIFSEPRTLNPEPFMFSPPSLQCPSGPLARSKPLALRRSLRG